MCHDWPRLCSLAGADRKTERDNAGPEERSRDWVGVVGTSRESLSGRPVGSLNQRQHNNSGKETRRKFSLGFSLSLLVWLFFLSFNYLAKSTSVLSLNKHWLEPIKCLELIKLGEKEETEVFWRSLLSGLLGGHRCVPRGALACIWQGRTSEQGAHWGDVWNTQKVNSKVQWRITPWFLTWTPSLGSYVTQARASLGANHIQWLWNLESNHSPWISQISFSDQQHSRVSLTAMKVKSGHSPLKNIPEG